MRPLEAVFFSSQGRINTGSLSTPPNNFQNEHFNIPAPKIVRLDEFEIVTPPDNFQNGDFNIPAPLQC